MNQKIFPRRDCTIWGMLYLLFELLALPVALTWLNDALGFPLNEGALNLVYYTINFAVLCWIFRQLLGDSFRSAARDFGPVLAFAVLFFVANQVLTTLVDMTIWQLLPDFSNVNDANIAAMVRENRGLWFLATVVLVPLSEELLFRGVLFGGLYPRSKVLAWTVSVLGFSLLHVLGYIGLYSWDVLLLCALQYLPAGLCFAGAYLCSGNVLAPVLIHSVSNAIAMLSLASMP